MLKKAVKQKDGSALLIAIVIMMVVTMLSLLLLLAGYSFFATSLNQQSEVQCREMAENISLELEQEITDVPNFTSFTEEKKAIETDTYPLWSYLRINLWQGDSWPYYNAKEVNHDETHAYRYFDVSGLTDNGADVLDDAEVLLYWTNTATADRATSSDQLYVQVTCRKGKEESTVTTVYDIQIASDKEYALESQQEQEGEGGTVEIVKTYYSTCSPSSKSNPEQLQINPEEKWTFTKAERF